MDFQSYDEYMRATLGYPSMNSQMNMGICPNMCAMPYSNPNMMATPMGQNSSCNLDRFYPDSYTIIYPLVVSTCRNASMPFTEDMINRMTDDIYDKAVADSRISIDINIDVEKRETSSDRVVQRPPKRPRRNRFLRDFIKVLLLRELIGGRPRF